MISFPIQHLHFDRSTDAGSTKSIKAAVNHYAGYKQIAKRHTTTNEDSDCGLEILYDATYTLIFKSNTNMINEIDDGNVYTM